MSHRELLAKWSTQDLAEAIVFDRIEPMEDSWIQSALLLSLLRAYMSGKRVMAEDIYPFLGTDIAALSDDEKSALLMAQLMPSMPVGEIRGEKL